MTYIRRERDCIERAAAEGRQVAPTRLLPMLPAAVAAQIAKGGNGGAGNGNGHGHVPALTAGHGPGSGAGDDAGHGHG